MKVQKVFHGKYADIHIPYSEGVASRRRLVLVAVYFMPITYIACLFVAFLKCVPFDHQWQIYPNPGSKFGLIQHGSPYLAALTDTICGQTTVCLQSRYSRPSS